MLPSVLESDGINPFDRLCTYVNVTAPCYRSTLNIYRYQLLFSISVRLYTLKRRSTKEKRRFMKLRTTCIDLEKFLSIKQSIGSNCIKLGRDVSSAKWSIDRELNRANEVLIVRRSIDSNCKRNSVCQVVY